MNLKKKSWDINSITVQIQHLARETCNHHNDGFTAWGCKQDLYLLKETIDRALEVAPSFGKLENDWLDKREKTKIVNILSR